MACRDTAIFLLLIIITISGYIVLDESDQKSIKIGKLDVKRSVGSKSLPFCTPDGVYPNGTCDKHGVCSCLPNYEPLYKTDCMECISSKKCSDGYKKSENGSCIPECANECINGWCFSPNHCHCDIGFEYKEGSQSECEAICEGDCELEKSQISCKNGYPNENNSCSCNPGYEPDPQSALECRQIWCPKCEYSASVATNEYICDSTHENSLLDSTICLDRTRRFILCPPGIFREPSCTNLGECVGNNSCVCIDGYLLIGGKIMIASCKNICEPFCQYTHFHSRFPGELLFDMKEAIGPKRVYFDSEETYIDHTQAYNVPKRAYIPFKNVNCFGPYNCRCWEGYTFVQNSTTECEPTCVPPCVNGTCNEYNICECFDDFEPEVGPEESWKCVPSCLVDCGNGTCIPPDSCVCFEGFHLDRNQTCVLMEPGSSKRLLIPTELVIGLSVGVLVLFATIVLIVVYFNKRHTGSYLVSYKKIRKVPEFRHPFRPTVPYTVRFFTVSQKRETYVSNQLS